MRRVFADTFYWVALLYRRDPWHARVTTFSETLMDDDVVFTTDAVFLELLAALSAAGPYLRHEAVLCVDGLLNDPSVRVVEVSRPLFLDGLALYRARPDAVARRESPAGPTGFPPHMRLQCLSAQLLEQRKLS